ncbi:hypothetical protein PAPYR_8420 [Paratrimastix pyriformis]|uniref:Uncharacterized protein n=1 Tax=Paratrimastix pyriformis TaxID=342808 RepID=A0ABQ8UG54_9EUKA|nr:hypothetical protein PAPYR_8420 [Paratrimastix pyriformis]
MMRCLSCGLSKSILLKSSSFAGACISGHHDPATRLCPSRIAHRLVQQMQCHCPNLSLECEAVGDVLDVERHLGTECPPPSLLVAVAGVVVTVAQAAAAERER